MRNILLTGLLLCASAMAASSQITEDFSDGELFQNPTWQGEDSVFRVNDDTQLQSQKRQTTSSFYLSTGSSFARNCEWEFWIQLGFNTSSANYVDVFLIADQENLRASKLNGYFVRFGGTSDEVSLFKMVNGSATKLVDGADGLLNKSSSTLRVKVQRSYGDQFKLYIDAEGGENYILSGTCIDSSIPTSSSFGICITQSTASFFEKHFFDDLYIGPIRVDTIPPKILSLSASDSSTLNILFSENMDTNALKDTLSYRIEPGTQHPSSCLPGSDNKSVKLTLKNALQTGLYSCRIQSLKDKTGNLLSDTLIAFSYIRPYEPQKNDVLFNEVFADPSPEIGLPLVEYIELWNASKHTLSLEGWTYSDGSSTFRFKKDSINPKEHLILCPLADTASLKQYGRCVGLNPWPSLNNAEDHLSLKTAKNLLIDSLTYLDEWYRDPQKKQGGYALERIALSSTCGEAFNWLPSEDSTGGSPGQINSIQYRAWLVPEARHISVADSTHLLVSFNPALDSIGLDDRKRFSLEPDLSFPDSILWDKKQQQLRLTFATSLSEETPYTLTIDSLPNCFGKYATAKSFPDLVRPYVIHPNDIIINEVLFNPFPEGVDFVELYNRSQKMLDLSTLKIADKNSKGGINPPRPISDSTLLLAPGEYLALCSNPDILRQQYHIPENARIVQSILPNFNDDTDAVILVVDTNQIIDRFDYTEDLHWSGLRDREGVSLERLHSESPSQDPNNWHSAAGSAGYATPGYINSQVLSSENNSKLFTIEPESFSPDNDGYHDVLTMYYQASITNRCITIRIFSDQGKLIRTLANNSSLGADNTFLWDGTDEQRIKAPIGIYIIQAELFDASGIKERYQKSCVLAARLSD